MDAVGGSGHSIVQCNRRELLRVHRMPAPSRRYSGTHRVSVGRRRRSLNNGQPLAIAVTANCSSVTKESFTVADDSIKSSHKRSFPYLASRDISFAEHMKQGKIALLTFVAL